MVAQNLPMSTLLHFLHDPMIGGTIMLDYAFQAQVKNPII